MIILSHIILVCVWCKDPPQSWPGWREGQRKERKENKRKKGRKERHCCLKINPKMSPWLTCAKTRSHTFEHPKVNTLRALSSLSRAIFSLTLCLKKIKHQMRTEEKHYRDLWHRLFSSACNTLPIGPPFSLSCAVQPAASFHHPAASVGPAAAPGPVSSSASLSPPHPAAPSLSSPLA